MSLRWTSRAVFKRYDVGASAGIGFGFSLGENFFGTVGARYSIGFIDIRENTSRGVGPVKTSVVDGRFGFWLLAGWQIGARITLKAKFSHPRLSIATDRIKKTGLA